MNQQNQAIENQSVAGEPGAMPKNVIRIDEGVMREHLDRVVCSTVEESPDRQACIRLKMDSKDDAVWYV